MKRETIPIADVYVPIKRRATLEQKRVDELAASILDKGLLAPILVRADGERFVLVEGLHRLEAAKALGAADGYFPRACWSNTLSTASVMASTPVAMVGFGTGANKGEWLPGSCGPSPSRAAATRSGS